VTDLAAHGIDLPAGSDTHNSIGGLLFSDLGRLPKRGDKIDVNGYELRVEPVRENPSLWYGSASVATFRTSRRRRRSRDRARDDGVPPSATAIRCTECHDSSDGGGCRETGELFAENGTQQRVSVKM
jgi:hypothetical protein